MAEEDIEFETFDGDIITKSDYRTSIIDNYIQAHREGLTKITDFTVGSEAYHLADVMASLMLEFRTEIDNNYRMIMIHTAEGEFLDNYGDMAGVHRIGSSPSVGNVVFTRLSEDTTNPITIPEGTIVSTEDAISFVVDETMTIASGETECTCSVFCEQEGEYTNVEPNTIRLVMGVVGSLVSVNNTEKFTEGENSEEDDDYRARILLSPYSVPTGTLAWYDNSSIELESVHDVRVRKGTIITEPDIRITFNPVDWEDTVTRADINEYNETNDIENEATFVMTSARADLVDLFLRPEYDIAGVEMGYHLAEKYPVLESDDDSTFLFAVLLKAGYLLEEVKPKIIEKINKFNQDALIGIEFGPSNLAVIIENEVDGVSICKIVERTGTDPDYSYTEIINHITMGDDNLYQVDVTDLEDRVVTLNFNLDLEVDDE